MASGGQGIRRVPSVDLARFRVVGRPSRAKAELGLMAQIYRWFSTRQASEVLYTQGVLMNKLMYYAAESVRAVNPHFKIDTG